MVHEAVVDSGYTILPIELRVFSSVGESAALIRQRSVVRVHQDPPRLPVSLHELGRAGAGSVHHSERWNQLEVAFQQTRITGRDQLVTRHAPPQV